MGIAIAILIIVCTALPAIIAAVGILGILGMVVFFPADEKFVTTRTSAELRESIAARSSREWSLNYATSERARQDRLARESH